MDVYMFFYRCQKAAICNWLVSQSSAHSKEPKGRVWISQAEERGNETEKVRVEAETMIMCLQDCHPPHLL